jgi:TPR repeat protein
VVSYLLALRFLLAGASLLVSACVFAVVGEIELPAAGVEPGTPDSYLQQAEKGVAHAQYTLGKLYFEGNETTTQDPDKAAYWFRQVIFSGDSEYIFGAMMALQSLQEVAVQHYPSVDPEILTDMGSLPPGAILIEQGREEDGIDLLIRLAWLLDVESQLYLKLLYKYSIGGVPAFHPKVLEFYKDSAAEGMPHSNLFLAKIQYYGWGVERNRHDAISHAMAAGDLHEAKELLGDIYFEVDDVRAAEMYWQEAAELGSSEGAYELGVLYRDRKEYKKAITWFEKTLDLNEDFFEAMMNLGQIHIEGWGTEVDLGRGFTYYKQAADEAEGEIAASAQYLVGYYYYSGIGIEKSEEQALVYMRRSAENGSERAQKALDNMQ